MDKRWTRLGEILVEKSAKVQPGEKVLIAMVELEAFDLAKAVYASTVKSGGYPQVIMLSEEFKHSLLRYGNQDQISRIPDIEQLGMDWADVYFGLRGAHNLGELSDIDAERLASHQKANGVISTQRWEKTRWTLIRIPTEAFAVQADCDYDTILDMFFDACFVDFSKQASIWTDVLERLNNGKKVRIVGKETDLSFSVEGRKFIPFYGDNNMPDGEILTSPVTTTIDGYIYFENPGVLSGRLIKDIRLKWEKGKLVHFSSSTHEDFLRSVITENPGADTIGEFAFGINEAVTRFSNDILFDEKILGTVHIALGRAYGICGGTNKSAIHWDIVKDTRISGSTVFLDDIPILKDGNIVI